MLASPVRPQRDRIVGVYRGQDEGGHGRFLLPLIHPNHHAPDRVHARRGSTAPSHGATTMIIRRTNMILPSKTATHPARFAT